MEQGSTRREALKVAGGTTVAVFAGTVLGDGGIAVAVEPGRAAFLTGQELRELRALVDVLIPADQDGGAVAGGCAEAIDALLGAFAVSPPRIYAGGPFSDRGGAARNDFARFLKLDRYEETAWRLRIEGSKGRPDLERNGPVEGWQQTYRKGLAALAAGGFAGRPAAERELALRSSSDPAVTALLGIAWPHTWELMYGPPEYGGNRDLLGWRYAVLGRRRPAPGLEPRAGRGRPGPRDDGRPGAPAAALRGAAGPRRAGRILRAGRTTSWCRPAGAGGRWRRRSRPSWSTSARRPGVAGEAVVVGSGAAGSVVAHELARKGWSVTVLERGRNLRPGFGRRPSAQLGTRYGSDELKSARRLGFPDGLLEPYTARTQEEAADGVARSATGALGQLGAAVGGTTLHYNAKFPRFWKQDFAMLSELGPVAGAQLADWPITYEDLAPFYDEVERRVGVQGDLAAMPARTQAQAPRSRPFDMPPNPVSYVGRLLRDAAGDLGYTAYPQPAAVNSRPYAGRPACTSCGLCSGFGCPVNARGDALVSFLNPAVRTGRVEVVPRAFAYRVDTTRDGKRVTGVRYVDERGRKRRARREHRRPGRQPDQHGAAAADVSAADPHPDGLGNRSGQVGRNMMFHNFTLATALLLEDVHPNRSQSNPLQMDDLMGPFSGPEVQALGVPYVKGGLVQVAGALPLFAEAALLAGAVGYGRGHKELMRLGVLHRRIAGSQLVGEDLPQARNRVDLDPKVRDLHGFPAARITYSPHQHEKAAAILLGARLEAMHLRVRGAVGAAFIPYPLISTSLPATAHLAGTARMGTDPRSSVCDASGRLHEVEGVYVADASTFPTFPGFNPTNTIMANALRIARGIAGGSPAGRAEKPRRAAG